MRTDKGKPFMDVPADYTPAGAHRQIGERCDYCGASKIGKEALTLEEHRTGHSRCRTRDAIIPILSSQEPPTFSEAFLYETVGKGDARFILGVAEEYDHVVRALGPKALGLLLDVKPRLCQRLGLPEAVIECLKDAESFDHERRESQLPSQVILDDNSARSIWRLLHGEYRRLFNPEVDMDRDSLRAYHTLTEALGGWAKDERQKEIDRLPEKLEKQAKRRQQLPARKKARTDKRLRVKLALVEHGMAEDKAEDAAYYAVHALGEDSA